MKYSIIGLGKLGASMAAAIASRGLEVVGLDVNAETRNDVAAGRAPVVETDLDATLRENRERITVTESFDAAVRDTDITFVVVPTPSDDRGAFSIAAAADAFTQIGTALKNKSSFHTVVLTSTVLPGATRYGLLPLLERASGRRCGEDFGLCYSPEFIALGSVIRDFLNPDFVLIGEHDERSGDHLARAYTEIHERSPVIRRMSIENAELTKLAVNTFLTTKISFANLLCRLCERMPGGDVDVVTAALGSDSRIGSKYLKGALGYGGPCFPRDNAALAFFAKELGVEAGIPEATDRMNRSIAQSIVELVLDKRGPGATVAVLGLAYKPQSHVTEASQGIEIVKALAAAGIEVVAYDPLANDMARREVDGNIVKTSCQACLEAADMVVITTPDAEFSALTAEDFASKTVVDTWRILQGRLSEAEGIEYIPYGRSTEDQQNAEALAALWRA